MTVYDAIKLIHDGHPTTQATFMTCHSWFFEHEGVNYRLTEWKGDKLFLEIYETPRRTIHEVSLVNQ